MDHQTKNKEHKQLVQDMELGLKRVMLVGGVAQRLLGKVAIVTGTSALNILHTASSMTIDTRFSVDGVNPVCVTTTGDCTLTIWQA